MSAFIVPGAATWRSCCGALCATCATLIVAILIGSSFHELTPVQMGLDYDGLAHRVNDKILYENGRWFLGPAHSFIVFPRTTRSILMRSAEAMKKIQAQRAKLDQSDGWVDSSGLVQHKPESIDKSKVFIAV